MEQQVLAWITQYGYLAIFFLLVFGIVGLPVPDETLLTFTGYLVYQGHLSLPLAFATALAGSISGITISYYLGRVFGMQVIHRYGRYLHISEEHFDKAHAWFERVGHWAPDHRLLHSRACATLPRMPPASASWNPQHFALFRVQRRGPLGLDVYRARLLPRRAMEGRGGQHPPLPASWEHRHRRLCWLSAYLVWRKWIRKRTQ